MGEDRLYGISEEIDHVVVSASRGEWHVARGTKNNENENRLVTLFVGILGFSL